MQSGLGGQGRVSAWEPVDGGLGMSSINFKTRSLPRLEWQEQLSLMGTGEEPNVTERLSFLTSSFASCEGFYDFDSTFWWHWIKEEFV